MKTIVRCRCGHRICYRDILRTDLYGRTIPPNYIWIKYRCSRCKQLGETFVAEESFDMSILQKDKRELTDTERDKFAEAEAITADELLDFRRQLAATDRVELTTFRPSEES